MLAGGTAMDLGLKIESVVVTGGGFEHGRAIVLAFAREGTAIAVGDIDAAQAGKTAEAARAAGAAGAQVVRTNVTRLSQVEAMFRAASGAVKVRTLVNNVGWDQLMCFTETTRGLWRTSSRSTTSACSTAPRSHSRP